MVFGGESFYNSAELVEKEALQMEAPREEPYSSPHRKLVKFLERSRNQWKAKAGAAKTVLKRLGTRGRRLERSKADYQRELGAVHAQVGGVASEARADSARAGSVEKKASPPQRGVVTGSEFGGELVRHHPYGVQHGRREGEQARRGLTGLVLALGALVAHTTPAVIKHALESGPTKTVLAWCREKLGKTVQATRHTLLAGERKAEQKQDQLPLAA